MKHLKLAVMVYVSMFLGRLIDAWKKDDVDPLPIGERVTLPSLETLRREAEHKPRERHDTLRSHQWPTHPGLHKVGPKEWN